jgi:hypothetical protein
MELKTCVLKTANVFKVQKRMVRSILDVNFNCGRSSHELFVSLNVMNVYQRAEYHRGLIMYKTMKNLTPNYIQGMFILAQNVNRRQTRASASDDTLLHPPVCRLHPTASTFRHTGVAAWNRIPVHI